ncbi:unnamed protein product [Angiostrongylus costaricensis]|uniref:Kinesin motor domain-containing protein n=1 Tax=Angiostrongylus costaricensis TaxID=334426 RepID=A0A0R3PHX5_ANGCS|nr:unnamed protein product [Angiostrongylus costaricensis]
MGSGKAGGDNVVVAVRVRPFNDREKSLKARLVVEIPDGQRTCIRCVDPNCPSNEKWFTFDHSYWWYGGFKEEKDGHLSPADDRYADQSRAYADLGRGAPENAWAGYNCSLFAYVQTGSGKSYSIVGFKGNKGIVPPFCEELLQGIEEKRKSKKNCSYEVFSPMLEIYCEKIHDLLSSKEPPKGGLKLREHATTRFYVENLSSAPASSYEQIDGKDDESTKNRTITVTNMNATSSRAHTIVKLIIVQKFAKTGGGTTTKKFEINLVDLDGRYANWIRNQMIVPHFSTLSSSSIWQFINRNILLFTTFYAQERCHLFKNENENSFVLRHSTYLGNEHLFVRCFLDGFR